MDLLCVKRDIVRKTAGNPRGSRALFGAAAALLFGAGVSATLAWCGSMPGSTALPMPGGAAMPLAWSRLCDETRAGAMAAFAGMWLAMTAAMMAPTLTPMLWRLRDVHRTVLASLLAGLGYFFVWLVSGVAVYLGGLALVELATCWPALTRVAPLAGSAVVIAAGLLEASAWKARRLARCHDAVPSGHDAATFASAWRDGLRLGIDCHACCANWMAVLLVVGVMDLRAMIAIGVAITVERHARHGARVARVSGCLVAVAGAWCAMQALQSYGFLPYGPLPSLIER